MKWLREELIETFSDTKFNQHKKQKLQLLRDTEMEVHIEDESRPKRSMKPIPCPLNLQD